ncbi:MAG: GNAT family N-acetyltransferase [Treponemataceae bacterium]|nr:GNAT family N-acetyltransferase [Treponemataceae bacterium]
MNMKLELVTIEDYDDLMALWNSVGMSKRALNPVDDSRDGIERFLKRNPTTCFKAVDDDGFLAGVILTGHDGRRGTINHMCVNPKYQRRGIGSQLVSAAEAALKAEGIQKIFALVFRDNDTGNAFWEQQGYSLRTDLNYRNKSLNPAVPTGK